MVAGNCACVMLAAASASEAFLYDFFLPVEDLPVLGAFGSLAAG